jgi:hypothetical protein
MVLGKRNNPFFRIFFFNAFDGYKFVLELRDIPDREFNI